MSVDIDAFITEYGGWTEPYFFYNGDVQLRYDPKDHVYMLVTPDGLEVQSGVTSVCHVIDKSEALLPWACKMMAQKLLLTMPRFPHPDVETMTRTMVWADFEKLVLDAKSAHKEKLEEAGIVGNIAHNWIEAYIKTVLAEDEPRRLEHLSQFPADERAKNCCVAALDWMSKHNVRWISTERKIYSRKYKYAGTMDGLCIVDSCGDPDCCPHSFTDRLSVADWKSSNYLYMEYMLQTAAYQAAYMEEHGVEIQDRWVIRLGKEDGKFDPWHMESECFQEDFAGFLFCLNLTRSIATIKTRIKAKATIKSAAKKLAKVAAREKKKIADVEEKQRLKLEKASAKLTALAVKCRNADKYKGTRKPTCNKGNPCETCRKKYEEMQAAKSPAPQIKRNRAQCGICFDIIESKYRHDFVECKGGHIFVDGGNDYFRSGTLTDGVTFQDIHYLDEAA